MASNNSNTLVDEKLAVSLFLDSLLRETEVITETTVISEIEQISLETKPEIIVDVPIANIQADVETTTAEKVIETKIEINTTEDRVVEIKSETALDVAVPEIANEPFQILLFEVAGLKLAVPLRELSGVIEWTDSVTEMPGHADFYMGILQHLDNKIAVIDTARMVLPTKKLEQFAGQDPRKRVNHIVLIDDYKWGLACDKIGEVITLSPDEVRWKTSKTSRRWLAGTVIEHMCALLNSEGFSEMIEKGHKASD